MDYPIRNYNSKFSHAGMEALAQTICLNPSASTFALIAFPTDILLLVLNALKAESVESLVPLRLSCRRFKQLIPPLSDIAIRICELAAGNGLLGLVQWGRFQGARWLDSIEQAARRGNLHVLEWAHTQGARSGLLPEGCTPQIYCAAASGNQIPILAWAKSKGYPVGGISSYQHNDFLYELAKLGDVEALKWAIDNKFSTQADLCVPAAIGGHLRVLQFLRGMGHTWDDWTTYHASVQGHFEVLEWAVAGGCPMCDSILDLAALSGKIEIVDWLVKTKGLVVEERTVQMAAKGGHLPLLKEFVNRGYQLNVSVSSAAAESGNLELVQWVHAQGCRNIEFAVSRAVGEGHLHVVQWLLQKGYSSLIEPDAVHQAGEHGYLEGLLWLLKNNYPLSSDPENTVEESFLFLADMAVEWDHPELLEYVSHKVQFNESIAENAAEHGHLETLKWLRSLNPPCPWSKDLYWRTLEKENHWEIIAWAFKNGCPVDTEFTDEVFDSHPIKTFKWLINQGFPWDVKLVLKAKEKGREEYLALSAWLVEKLPSYPMPSNSLSLEFSSTKRSLEDANSAK